MVGDIDFEAVAELFAATVEWIGDGRTRTKLGGCTLEIDNPLAVPPVNPPEGVTWPEQVFPAALAACWITTLTSIAERMGAQLESLRVTVKPLLALDDDGGFRFDEMRVYLEIGLKGDNPERIAARLVELTHKYCLISKAIKGNVRETINYTIKKE